MAYLVHFFFKSFGYVVNVLYFCLIFIIYYHDCQGNI